jgi:pimeloyl-ACP methyl ester carboxylesterase
MKLLKTRSFELAIYDAGNEASPKLALVLPGRLDTKDYANMQSHVAYLASKGYYAVSFDPPGTWDSPGDISLYTTTNYLRAINELIEHFGNKPTFVLGHSRGGSMALLAGTRNPYITHMVAVMSHHGATTVGLPNTKGETVKSLRDLPPGTSRTAEKKEFMLPYAYFEDQAQYDSLEDLTTCDKPKLFFYGTDDVLVTPDSVKAMYEAAADPKILHKLQTEHDYRLHEDMIAEVNQTVGQFLAEYPA